MVFHMRRFWQYVRTVLKVMFRHPIAGTTIVPVLPDGRLVLIQRRDTGEWGLPGGIIDWGEPIAVAAGRELEEETGLNLVKIRRLVGVYSAPDRDPRIHSICVVVEADVDGQMQVRDTLEIQDVRAFSLDSLPQENLCHDHAQQLQDYLTGKTTLA
jgi:ADP-ribose pyrophosphatase YjhB (NUDIX family)